MQLTDHSDALYYITYLISQLTGCLYGLAQNACAGITVKDVTQKSIFGCMHNEGAKPEEESRNGVKYRVLYRETRGQENTIVVLARSGCISWSQSIRREKITVGTKGEQATKSDKQAGRGKHAADNYSLIGNYINSVYGTDLTLWPIPIKER